MVNNVFKIFIVVTMSSQSLGQFFGGRQNFPSGGFSQQAGYRAGPAWGSLSQSFNDRGFGTPIKVGGGVDFKLPGSHGIGGSASVIPGVGGQGSLYGTVNILDGPKHNLNIHAQHDRFLNRDLKPIGPPTNSLGVNYNHANGIGANVGASKTDGGPLRGSIGASIPIVSKPNGGGINLGVQTSVGQGMKPDHYIGLEAKIPL
ncbi:hypothetical protein RI129_008661 [Pyrocoelia pectoralis]|uniref:Uncharacterized protein n=1 Tax=Pyrocoelia pectoralis TaxID=417401 RepID=A0AAN7VEI8_9COLE